MKLLLLATSQAVPRKGLTKDQLIHNQRDPERDAAVGMVEQIVHVAWPTPRLPDLVTEWIQESEPDAVMFVINEFWFNYRSVPALVSRRFGPFGRPIALAGAWATQHPTVAYSRAFRRARSLTEEKVGADAHFEPDEVIAVSKEVIRRMTRAEGPVPLVLGPMGTIDNALAPPMRAEGVNRRVRVDAALEAFCEANHVEYWGIGSEVGRTWPGNRASTLADGVHRDAAGVGKIFEHIKPHLFRFFVGVMQQQMAVAASQPTRDTTASARGDGS